MAKYFYFNFKIHTKKKNIHLQNLKINMNLQLLLGGSNLGSVNMEECSDYGKNFLTKNAIQKRSSENIFPKNNIPFMIQRHN